MDTSGLTLLIPERADPERDIVADAWTRGGGAVHRLARFWDPPAFPASGVRVYGNETFCLVLQQKLGLSLQTPRDDLALEVPSRLLGREVARTSVSAIDGLSYPRFVKTLVPKLIPSRVYASAPELVAACAGMDGGTELFVSEPVVFAAEARAFVLDGCVLDAALYEGAASLSGVQTCVLEIVESVPAPRAVVVDVGLVDGVWRLVELNAAWGAGLNGCGAEAVLPAIAAASGP